MSDFPCTGCGICCQRAGRAVVIARELISRGETNVYVQEVAAFPHDFDNTGRCSMLTQDNKCSVYDNRPLICDIKRVWEKFHKPTEAITLEQYYLSGVMECNKMMKEENVSDNFFIHVRNEKDN
jgi:Fe-S-cluster containining protein